MLARQLPGVPVLVSSDRYLAGRLAEHQFGVTLHLLDDGFQHLQLDRDVDLVIVEQDDSTRAPGRCRPAGCAKRRTRWPLRTRCWRMVRASAFLEVSTGPCSRCNAGWVIQS